MSAMAGRLRHSRTMPQCASLRATSFITNIAALIASLRYQPRHDASAAITVLFTGRQPREAAASRHDVRANATPQWRQDCTPPPALSHLFSRRR